MFGKVVQIKIVGMSQIIYGFVVYVRVLVFEDDFDFLEIDGLAMCRFFYLNQYIC